MVTTLISSKKKKPTSTTVAVADRANTDGIDYAELARNIFFRPREPSNYASQGIPSPGGDSAFLEKTEQPKPEKKNVVNKDGSVTITRGGVTETLSRDEYKEYLQRLKEPEAFKTASPSEAINRIIAEENKVSLPSDLGVIPTGMAQPEPVDLFGALGESAVDPGTYRTILSRAQAGGIAGGAAGLASFTPFGPVVGATGGALAGVGIGVWESIAGKIKDQRTDEITAATTVLADGRLNINRATAAMQQFPEMRDEFWNLLEEQMGNIDQSYATLKATAESPSAKYLGADAIKELQRYENYYTQGGLRDVFVAKARAAYQGQLTPEQAASLLATSTSAGQG